MEKENIRLGIISDTHGEAARCREIWENVFNNMDLVLHAGDVFYHGPRNPLPGGYDPQTLAGVINESKPPVLIARGNCDADVDKLLLNYPLQSPYLYTYVHGLKIMVCHGDMSWDEMINTAQQYSVDLFVFGHTHERYLKRKDGVLFLNPGSPSLPKGDGIPSIALVEEGKARILDISTGDLLGEETI